jgi:predicted small lipoprotein YifL
MTDSSLQRAVSVLLLATSAIGVTGCGLKGDLYIEEPAAEPQEEAFDTGAGRDEDVPEAEYNWMDLLKIEIIDPADAASADKAPANNAAAEPSADTAGGAVTGTADAAAMEPALEAAEAGRLEEYEQQEALQEGLEQGGDDLMDPELVDSAPVTDEAEPADTGTMSITPPTP